MFVSPTLLGIPFNLQLRQYLSGAFLGSLLSDGYLCILPTFRILFHWIVTLASHTFRIPFYSILRQYFVHFQDFLKSDRYGGTLRTLRILFPLMLRQYLAHLQNSFLVYFYVSILRTLRIRLYWIVLLISHTLRTPFHSILTLLFHPFYLLSFIGLLCFIRFLFNGLLSKYLAHVQNSLSIDCNVCIQHTCRILFHWIIRLVPCTHLGLESFPLDCFVNTSPRLGFSFFGTLRYYHTHF